MDEHTPIPKASFDGILDRVALPFFIFSAVLGAFLLASAAMVLPQFKLVEVSGKTYDAAQLETLRAELTAKVGEAEKRRDELVLPEQEPTHEQAKDERRATPSIAGIRARMLDDMKSIDPAHGIVVSTFAFDETKNVITLTGDVRNVGPRSMTLLAEFVDGLKKLPGVASIDGEEYVRQEDKKTGPHSPFSLTLHFQ